MRPERVAVLAGVLLAAACLGPEIGMASLPRNGVVTRRVIRPGYGGPGTVPTVPGGAGRPPSAGRGRRRSRVTAYRLIRRGELARWLNGILDRLRPHLKRAAGKGPTRPGRLVHYRVSVIDHPSVNAFTLSDGRIYVTRGLLEFIRSDDEMAGVLGHECAHVELRHHPKRAVKQMLWQGLALLGALMTRADGSGFIGAGLLGSLATLSYGRKQEYEADRLGFELVEKAGYDPTGMIDFINRLIEYEKKQSGKYTVSRIFASHPPTPSRARRLRAMAAGRGPFPPKLLSYDPAMFLNAPLQGPASGGPGFVTREGACCGGEAAGVEGAAGDGTDGTGTAGDGAGHTGSGGGEALVRTVFVEHFDVTPSSDGQSIKGDRRLPPGWTFQGIGAYRLDRELSALGTAALKLWSPGGGRGLRLVSPEIRADGTGPSGTFLLEILCRGPLSDRLRCSLSAGGSGWVAVEPVERRVIDGWTYARYDIGPVDDGTGAATLRFRFGLDGRSRGALWLDEMRFGYEIRDPEKEGRRLYDSLDPGMKLIENGDFGRGAEGWLVETGVVEALDRGGHDGGPVLRLRPERGGRRIVLSAVVLGEQDLARGYFLRFFVKAHRRCRAFAGLQRGTGDWKPDGTGALTEKWKRVRMSGTRLPSGNGPLKLRLEFTSTFRDYYVLVDDVALVPLMRDNYDGE